MTDVFDDDLAAEVATALLADEHRIVFAESCTAGLLAASVARIPGVSRVLAGSAVTYQIPTKTAWLNIDPDTVEQHDVVSEQVSREMATGALALTPHATISASITGHLGPDAPASLDGTAFTTVCLRTAAGLCSHCRRLQLVTLQTDGLPQRRARQIDAVGQVLRFVLECLRQKDAA
ncbi:MAG: nicotinamide-nucleotide amidohydrolase family protein [Planctomycetaceae bacterium]|nr:nicotinamide-nucleotide amidohydrolase family protein [Planctomycetaceae bacterium]